MAEVPVDSGWAWVALCGAFICLLLNFGTMRVIGVLFVEFAEYYDASSTATSTMLTMFTVGVIIVTPVYELYSARFSLRILCFLGGLIWSFGHILQPLCTNIWLTCIVFGLMSGIGFSITFLSNASIIGVYFKAKLSLASGIVFSGASCGQTIMPQLLNYLLEQFGLKGAMLICGGLMLHVCAAAMLFTPPSFYADIKPKEKILSKQSLSKNQVWSLSQANNNNNGITCTAFNTQAKPYEDNLKQASDKTIVLHITNLKTHSMKCDTNRKASGSDFFITKNIPELPEGQSDIKAKAPDTGLRSLVNDIKQLLQMRSFILLIVSMILLLFMFFLPVYFPPYAASHGLSSSEIALLLTISGSLELPSRIFHGWVTAYVPIDASLYTAIAVFITGGGVIACDLFLYHYAPYVIIVFMSVFMSSIYALQLVILTNSVGTKLLSRALSFITIGYNLLMTFVPTLLGLLYDATGSYRSTVQILMVAGSLGGILTLTEKYCRKKRSEPPLEVSRL